MSDPSPRPATTHPEEVGKVTEIVNGAGAAGLPTLPGDHPHAPHPSAGSPQPIGDYLIVGKIGEGGMGAVYLAEDTRLRRKVAVKTMRPELAANPVDRGRFEREARTAAMVDHDYIVPILHVGEAADGTPFIVMPFLQGESLDARLKRDGTVPLDLLLKIARETAEGLAAAHAKGLIHRDIKPANIWLEGDSATDDSAPQVRRCKILDFGLARPVEGGDDAQLTGSGAVIGTPAYMSPEQARGAAVDHRADLFSLGATLYRAASGTRPFTGPTPMAVMIALSTEAPKPIRALAPNLSPALAALIDRLMRKDPARRPQSATEVAAEVRKIEAELHGRGAAHTAPVPVAPIAMSPPEAALTPTAFDLPTTADDPEPPAPRTPRTPPRRFPWPLAVGGLLLLVSGALGVWFAVKDRPRQQDPNAAKKEPKDGPRNAEPAKKEGPAGFPADRAAARWVLSVGGDVQVNGADRDYRDTKELPKEPFKLTGVRINSKSLGDDSLSILKDCKHIQKLDLGDNLWLSDAGLAHFHPNPEWKKLDLGNTSVGDKSVAWIKRCSRLADLELRKTQITQKGINELRDALPECIIQWDGGRIDPWAKPAPVPDSKADRKAAEFVLAAKGSVYIDGATDDIKSGADLPKRPFRLTAVFLTAPTQDADLAVFAECRNVTTLSLAGTGITSAGLAHFKDCKGLKELYLSGTQVDGKAVPVIKGFTKLTDLSVGQTKLTEKDVKEIAEALPGCRIQYDGGTLEPKKK